MPNGAVASRHPTETLLLSLRPSFALHQPTICPLFHQAVRVAVSFHNSPASRFSPRELTAVPRFAYICASLLHGPRGLSPRQSRSGQLPCSGHAISPRGNTGSEGWGAVLMGRAAGGKHGRRRAAAAERGNGCGNAALVAVVYGEVPWAAAASAGAGEHGQVRRQAPKRRRPEEGEAAEAEAAEEAVKTSRRCRALTYYGSVVGALMSCTQAWCFVQGWAL